ncbi:MAG TPA: DUF4384 domain-containing protein [Firmicutes bacterium]|nr:DUF4384 domain-containing protein [Bacillota bacterium]
MERKGYLSIVIIFLIMFVGISLNAETYKTNQKKNYKTTKKTVKKEKIKVKGRAIGRVERVTKVVGGRVIVQPYRIVHHGSNFRVNIWTNRNEYYPGDRIKVYVRSNRNCYIVVYDIDTEGNISIIYPEYGTGYLRAYRTRRIDRWWYVDGPEGYEQLVVVASRSPIDAYDYGMYLRNELGYNRNRGYFKVVPRRYRRISIASINFYINGYYGYEYDDDYYYDDYDYGYGINDGFGFIIVEAPVWGWIYIDGTYYGRGNCRVPKMKPGWHTITVKQSGKIKYKKRIYVNKNKKYKISLKSR